MKKAILSLFFLLMLFKSFAQLPEEMLNDVSNNHTIEKIYIHYDKQYYTAGETVWFKIYLMQGFFPASISTTINVTLLNDSKNIISNLVLPIYGGAIAKGNLSLSSNLPSGSYTIVANTVNMKNFGKENFYNYSFNIYNPKQIKTTDINTDQSFINFLPEGGNLIAGINNTIAFKCTDNWGYPIEMTGTVENVRGDSVASFKTTHDGMGTFKFVPFAGEKYIANCKPFNNQPKKVSLPNVLNEGVLLNVKMINNQLLFEVDKSTVLSEKLLPEYILGVEENNIALKAQLTRNSSFIKGLIPMDNLETGILQLTVFNKMHQPLAERLVFVNKEDYKVDVDFKTDTKNLSNREKNEFSFTLLDTITGSYSVSITDGGVYKANIENKENIHTRFLIHNQLKGYIHNATYYLEKNDDTHRNNLDLVMLTHGWRKHSWDEILNKKLPQIVDTENSFISINGSIKNKISGVSMGNTEITAVLKTNKGEEKYMDFINAKSDDNGTFKIPSLIFEDTAKISFINSLPGGDPLNIILSKQSIKKDHSIITYNFKPKKFENNQFDGSNSAIFNEGIDFKDGITLNTIFLKTFSKKSTVNTLDRYENNSIGGMANTTLDFIKYPPKSGGLNVLEYLKSRLPGVNISGRPGNYTIQLRSIISISGAVPNVSVFIDGIPANAEIASTYSLNDIALVQLYSSTVRAGIGGALVLYTKKQEDREDKFNLYKGEIMLVEGYSPVKEFYSPNYTLPEDASILKDVRTTLYWNPNLTSDGTSKKISFSFYNSDKAKNFNVIIEGMTKDGKLIHLDKIIE